jgi:hypothetical protein
MAISATTMFKSARRNRVVAIAWLLAFIAGVHQLGLKVD